MVAMMVVLIKENTNAAIQGNDGGSDGGHDSGSGKKNTNAAIQGHSSGSAGRPPTMRESRSPFPFFPHPEMLY